MGEMKDVPYVVYESAQTRSERIIKRLIVALIIVTAMMFVTNIIWLHEWMSYGYEALDEEITVASGFNGHANYIGNDGSIVNGADYSEAENYQKN